MHSTNYILITIIGCGIVTWISRVFPFVLLKHVNLPKGVVEYLSFVPIVIMTTLWFSELLVVHPGHLPSFNLTYLITAIPTLFAAIISKSLLVIVAVGMVSLAVLRMIGFA